MTFSVPCRVDFSISEAQWLADLHGIADDLRGTKKLCAKALELMRPWPTGDDGAADWVHDTWLAGELSFSAVVRYGRTFGTGVRKGIPSSWIASLPPAFQARHNYFKDIRDKFVAHSVNAFEDNQVFASLSQEESPQITSVSVDTGRYMSLSATDVENLSQLTGALKHFADMEIARETSRVLQLARSWPISDLLARSSDNRPIPSAEDVGKRRPRS